MLFTFDTHLLRYSFLLFILLSIPLRSYSQKAPKVLYLEILPQSQEAPNLLNNFAYTTSFNERAALQEQIDTLTKQIKAYGYIDLRTDVTQKNDSTITAQLDFGTFYKTLQLSLDSNTQLYSYIKETGLPIKQDSIEIETAFAKAYLEQLTTISANSGDPFARFQIIEISKNQDTLKGTLSLTSNKIRTVDKYVLNGYEDFPRGYLTYYARLKEGAPFNQKKLIRQNELLTTLPFVSSIKEPEVLFKNDSTIAYYYLKKNTINQFDGFLGFASGEDAALRLDGYLDLLLTNNLNYGESLSLNYKADGNDQVQLRVKTTLPYLLKTPLGLEAEIALFRRDSTFSTSDLSATLYYTASQRSTIGLGYLSQTSENLQDNGITPTSGITDYTTNAAIANYTYTRTQSDYFFPIKTQVYLKTGYAVRQTSLEETIQVPIEFEASHFFQFTSIHGLYLRNITKYLRSDNFVTNELFRFGGIQSIRGFEENTLFANTLSILNTEYRLTLNQGLYVNTLLDLAYFENELLNEQSQLYSVGVGAGVRTRAGILKINLANGKFEDVPFRFSNTKLHLILAVRF